MGIDLWTVVIFFLGFTIGIRAGFVGTLIGIVVGLIIAFVFRCGIVFLVKRLPDKPVWLAFAGWIPIIMWIIICFTCAMLFTDLLTTLID